MNYTPTVVTILSVLTVLGQVLFVVLLACLLCEWMTRKEMSLVTRLSRHGIPLMLVVAATATGGSLFLSDIAGWAPCKLCWFQRIFMYPQVFLLALAAWQNDRRIAQYIVLLCIVGIGISTMHYIEQVMAALAPVSDALKPCDTTGVSCAKTPIFRFGYITVPLMAFTAFALNAAGAWAMLLRTRHATN